MSTLITLLLALVVLYIISRMMPHNKIDAYTKMLTVLVFGLLLGAGCRKVVDSIEHTDKNAVETVASSPMQSSSYSPVVGSVCDTIELAGQDTEIEGGTIVSEAEGDPNKVLTETDIIDDS
jgi:uncharacterized membrane protein YbjE (DUF340 family)